MDILLGLVFFIICVLSFYRKLVRQLMALGVVYMATVGAGLAYTYVATFFQAIGGATPTLTQFIMFWVTFMIFVIALEAMLHKGFEEVSLPKLGFLDRALAILPGVLVALIAVSLMMTTMGYSTLVSWKILDPIRVLVYQGYQHSALRPLLGQFLQVYMTTHSLWFPIPPAILGYALP